MSKLPPDTILIDGKLIDVKGTLRELDKADCQDTLYTFLKQAWRLMDPSDFTEGWAIEAVAEHLQAVVDGEILRLLINIPFRMGKSTICSVAFPAWTWAQPPKYKSQTSGPGVQFLFSSYALNLAHRDSNKCRRLIESPWYQSMWGNRFQLTADQNTKTEFDNTVGGARRCTAVASALTGFGGDILLADDPNNAQDAHSELVTEATKEWWNQAWSTRLNNRRTGAMIVIQQRLGEDDISGHILSKSSDEWTHLILPMRYERDRTFFSAIGWEDPRKEEGELLWPERFSEKDVKSLEKELGPWGTAGQLQQRPEPKGGGVIKRDWWKLWEPDAYPPMDYVLASLDTAYTTKTENDYSALTVWGVFSGDVVAQNQKTSNGVRRSYATTSPQLMLMYAWQERLEFNPLVKQVAKICEAMKVDKLLIENKAAGISVAQEIRRVYGHERFGVQLHDPKSVDKLARLYSVQHIFSGEKRFNPKTEKEEWVGGMVWAPDKQWAEMVMTQVGTFPKGKHDDLCFVAGTQIASRRGMIGIENVRVGDEVITPFGWKKVIAAACTGQKPVITRHGLTGTSNHPVFDLDFGWVRMDTVTQASKLGELSICGLIKIIRRSQSSLREFHIGEWEESASTIYRNQKPTLDEKAPKDFMSPYGKTIMDEKFQKGLKFIIKMAIPLTASLKIWKSYQLAHIENCLRSKTKKSIENISKELGNLLLNGTSLKKAARGIVRILHHILIKLESQNYWLSRRIVANAFGAGLISMERLTERNSAQHLAKRLNLDTEKEKENQPTNTICPVFNLTVEGAHCYFANGILVHNCDTVSQALRHLRDLGLLQRAPEAQAEVEESMQFSGRAPPPLYGGV